MKIKDAQQVIREAIKWLPEDSAGRVILKSFELNEYNGEAFAPPIPFSRFTQLDEWTLSTDNAAVTARIRHIQESMDTRGFPLCASLYLTHEKGYCVLVLGTEQVDVIRRQREYGGLPNVTISFPDRHDGENLPRFCKGDLVELSASSPLRGWLYLFCVDADRIISPVYPGEGERSEIRLTQNSRCNIMDKINAAIKAKTKFQEHKPLRYSGHSEGYERIVVLVVDSENPVPVTISQLRSRFPLPLLFSHEQRHKGIGYQPINAMNDFMAMPLERVALGSADYYYNT